MPLTVVAMQKISQLVQSFVFLHREVYPISVDILQRCSGAVLRVIEEAEKCVGLKDGCHLKKKKPYRKIQKLKFRNTLYAVHHTQHERPPVHLEYSTTPFSRINWDGQQSRYAESSDDLIFP